jgi:hypothetical protein
MKSPTSPEPDNICINFLENPRLRYNTKGSDWARDIRRQLRDLTDEGRLIGTRRLIALLRREGAAPGSSASAACHARPLWRADALNFAPKRGMKP